MPISQYLSVYFDKIEALKNFHEAEDFLGEVPASLLDDKEFATACITKFPVSLCYMSDRLRHDVDLSVMAINRNFCTGEALFDDVDTVYDSIPEDMKVNKELNMKLIGQDFWRPNLEFLHETFSSDKDVLIALLKKSGHVQVKNSWSLFRSLTQEDLLDIIKEIPSIIESLSNDLIMDKAFITKCLHANGEVMCSLASHDDCYETHEKCNKEFCEHLTTIALNSESGHGFHVMGNAFSALSMENVSENLWELAVNKSILCLSLEGCPARFFNDKKILSKGFDTSVIDFFTAKEIFADNDLILEIFEESMKDKNNDTFYIKQFTNMMRGVGYDLTDASGGEEAVNFMLKVMSAGALREIKTFSDNTFFTKGESERFYMSGFLTREDIKIRINEEIFKRDVYVIEKDSQSGSTMTSKPRKCLL